MNEENNVALISYDAENIKNLIYTIRGKQVMLDSDVAMLYQYETKKINQAVKRNIERFPEKFCFQLTQDEFRILRSQIGTLNEKKVFEGYSQDTNTSEIEMLNLKSQIVTSSLEKENGYGGKRKLPLVFTEQGIAMLSGLLRSEVAIKVSISIMDAFVGMRKFLATNGQVFERLTNVEYKLLEHDKKFDEVFNELQKSKETEFKQQIFFDGQIYDSYNLIVDIIKRAKEKILIVDNYIDDTILKMLSKKNKNVKVVILTSDKTNILKLDIQKFNKEYPTLEVAKTNKFHDRFIVIDNKELYHVGASLKDLGKKCFAISKIEDMEYINKISNCN